MFLNIYHITICQNIMDLLSNARETYTLCVIITCVDKYISMWNCLFHVFRLWAVVSFHLLKATLIVELPIKLKTCLYSNMFQRKDRRNNIGQ